MSIFCTSNRQRSNKLLPKVTSSCEGPFQLNRFQMIVENTMTAILVAKFRFTSPVEVILCSMNTVNFGRIIPKSSTIILVESIESNRVFSILLKILILDLSILKDTGILPKDSFPERIQDSLHIGNRSTILVLLISTSHN